MSETEHPAHRAPDESLPPPPESGAGSGLRVPSPAGPRAIPSASPEASPTGAWASTDPSSVKPPTRRRPTIVVAAILALALVAAGGTYFLLRSEPAASGPAASLRLAFDRGYETTYDIHMAMDGSMDLGPMGEQPIALDMTESVGWKVLRVEDGVATVRITIEGMSGSANGVPLPPGASGQSMTLRITPDGQIVGGGGIAFGAMGGAGLGGFPGMDQVTPILPDHSVAPGDEWDKHFAQSFPFGEGKIEYTAHSRLERYEQVSGVRAAVVTTTYRVPLDFSVDLGDLARTMGGDASSLPALGGTNVTMSYSGSGTFTQTSWVDVHGKQVVKSESDGEFDMTVSFPGLEAQLGTGALHMEATFRLEMTRR